MTPTDAARPSAAPEPGRAAKYLGPIVKIEIAAPQLVALIRKLRYATGLLTLISVLLTAERLITALETGRIFSWLTAAGWAGMAIYWGTQWSRASKAIDLMASGGGS